jgi:hypothetical protein
VMHNCNRKQKSNRGRQFLCSSGPVNATDRSKKEIGGAQLDV